MVQVGAEFAKKERERAIAAAKKERDRIAKEKLREKEAARKAREAEQLRKQREKAAELAKKQREKEAAEQAKRREIEERDRANELERLRRLEEEQRQAEAERQRREAEELARAKAAEELARKRTSKPYGNERAFLDEVKSLLLQAREETQLTVDSLNARAEELLVDRQHVEFDGDSNMDVGSDFEREQWKEQAERSAETIREIDVALTRVADGTYGRCDDCYGPIPKERLRSQLPVFLCVDCRRQRPWD